jgi:uncharacterized protein with HEPN domain
MKKSYRRLELIAEYGQTAQDFLHGKTVEEWRSDIKLRYAVAHALAGVVENLKEYSKDEENFQDLLAKYPLYLLYFSSLFSTLFNFVTNPRVVSKCIFY